MTELFRLLRYARRYMPALLASVVLMAVVGASQGLLLKLIPYIFDRVLKPDSPDTLVELFPIPFTDYAVYLNDFVPTLCSQRVDHDRAGHPRVLFREGLVRLFRELSRSISWD